MAVFGFPNPVNENAARVVAGGVVVLCALTLVLTAAGGRGWLWLTAALAYGFVARVLAGPRFSPLGRFATRVAAPRLGPERPVPGPPKRFAQGIGATLSVLALLAFAVLGLDTLAVVLVAMVLGAATLESVFGLCLGCTAFAALMRAGVIPEGTCEACANVGLRVS